MTMGEGRRRGYNNFSLRMSSSLSKRWMCVCCRKHILGFSLWMTSLILLWVMRVYIVRVKGKKVTFKNPPDRMFRDYLAGRPYSRDTFKTDSLARLFSFHHVLLMWLLRGLASREIHWFFVSCLILHQLNTKTNTIKFHKIQGTKLKQLQHFLSWNKSILILW